MPSSIVFDRSRKATSRERSTLPSGVMAVAPLRDEMSDVWQRSVYAPPRSRRTVGAGGVIALLAGLLMLVFWASRNHALLPASAARDTMVVTFNVARSAQQPRHIEVPPGPRQQASEAQRAAASAPASIAAPPPLPTATIPAPPSASAMAPAAAANSTASIQVERTTAPPTTVAPASNLDAAQEDVAAQVKAMTADWQARVLGHLRRYRRYPRAAESSGQQGIATIAITVGRQGQVLGVSLRHGSGYPLLDAEALATAHRASPLPPPDALIPGDPIRVEVPVAFSLDEQPS